jgi:hypothetical protein
MKHCCKNRDDPAHRLLSPTGVDTAVHDTEEAAQRLAALRTWRWSALAAGALVGAMSLAGTLGPAAGAVAVAAAVVLSSGAQLARHVLLDAWTLRDDLVGIPEIARARKRLVAADRRRELARSLRSIADQRRVSRHDPAPLLVDRLGPVRSELRAVAAELEEATAPDPRTVAEITGLITDGARSPLLNPAVPEPELAVALRRIRFRLAAARIGSDDLPPAC